MHKPSATVLSVAERLALELKDMGLGHDDAGFYSDPLGGRYRTVGRWRFQPGHPFRICVYTDVYTGGRHDCWVAFGSPDPSPVELIKDERPVGSFVEFGSGNWDGKWESLTSDQRKQLEHASFIVVEDWRPKGWVWFGRYFASDRGDDAIAFLHEIVQKPRRSTKPAKSDGKTEKPGQVKLRIGQAGFRSEVEERWGHKCALTGIGVACGARRRAHHLVGKGQEAPVVTRQRDLAGHARPSSLRKWTPVLRRRRGSEDPT
ncbi:hypothetical protein [Bradyrhizobium japonicum]|uniref:hypothetical protein n=1 Tax=Bradyrhizobium japonicum TaxID=375 RepID=UPI00200FD885|nr:hypothetical protein [Bradyrhizobium japonicum]